LAAEYPVYKIKRQIYPYISESSEISSSFGASRI